MNYVEHLNLFGIDAKEIPCIKGSGTPTTATKGAAGMFYMDTDTGATYKCTAVTDGVYTWIPTGEKIDIVQSAGDNESSVMSQKAVTDSISRIEDALSEKISKNDKRITNLEKGLTAEFFETDSTAAYAKSVPENALPYAEITKIGGMTRKCTNLWKSTDATYTLDGVTITCVDGVYVINGTPTASANAEVGSITLPAGTYSLSANNPTNNGLDVAICQCISSADNITARDVANYAKQEGAALSGGEYTLRIRVDAAVTYDNFIVQPMLNRGAAALDFEPYFEGLRSAPVTAVVGADSFDIPEAVQELDGYGNGLSSDCYNYIQWDSANSAKIYTKMVGLIDLGNVTWHYNAAYKTFYTQGIGKAPGKSNMLCDKYSTAAYNGYVASDKHGDMQIWGNTYTSGDAFRRVYVTNYAYTDTAEFKKAMKGIYLLYELATPEVTDISDRITDDNFIKVDGGGTVTFVNEHGYDVPSEITYMLKEESV